MNANIGHLLNQRFACPGCQLSGNWRATTRAKSREVSTIQGFRCRHCGGEIIVKVPRTMASSKSAGQMVQEEYHLLCELQSTFPQDDEFGTLVPLGYLQFHDCGAMITRKFEGVDLVRHAARQGLGRRTGLFRPAGVLLRKLHDSCPRGYQPQYLNADDKAAYLARTYGAELRGDHATCGIFDQWRGESARISPLPLRATWSHGDFKPENVLCDGHKYVILDTPLDGYGVFVYDLASFLNHLLLARAGSSHSRPGPCDEQAETEFLEGYGGVNQQELTALRWAQLYFMLCYYGRYRKRSLLSGIYANWRIRPLLQELAARL